MSVDGNNCRVCLAVQRTSKFYQIFGSDGKIAKLIYDFTGLKVLEFKECPALICTKCTGNLQKALELRHSILSNNRYFNELYKTCRFEEFDIETAELPDQSNNWPVDENVEIKNEPMNLLDYNDAESYHSLDSEQFIITEIVKQEPEFTNPTDIYENPATEIKSEIKTEPDEIQEYQFNGLPKEVLLALGSDDSNDISNYGCEDETSQSSSQQSRSSKYTTRNKRNLSPQQLERKRERDRIRKQQKRLNETEEEREARRQANAAIQRRRRERLTEQQRLHQTKQQTQRVLEKRSNETEDDRDKRLEAERIRLAKRRNSQKNQE